jgi:hypothetical protein
MILYRKISGDTKCEIPIRKIIVIDMIMYIVVIASETV